MEILEVHKTLQRTWEEFLIHFKHKFCSTEEMLELGNQLLTWKEGSMMVDEFTKKHEASINSATVAIDASTKACVVATEKVEKLFRDATLYLESLQGAVESNAAKVNSFVEKLATLFETE